MSEEVREVIKVKGTNHVGFLGYLKDVSFYYE